MLTEKKPTILVDMDDTINNFGKAFWETYNQVYGENQDHREVDSWNLQDYARDDINVYDLLKYPGLFRYVELKDYARSFINHLTSKYNVYMVTDSPAGTSIDNAEDAFSNPADDKRAWVQDNFPEFPQKNIIFCSCKWMIEGDILVDDKPETFNKFWENNKMCILMDAPYNHYIDTEWRVSNLRDAEKMIDNILQEK